MIKVLIIGKKSFIGRNLKKNLNLNNSSISYKDFLKKKESFIKKFNFIVNCSSNLPFIYKKYNKKFDYDCIIASKIKNINCKYIFLSTRKVYNPTINIFENGYINPRCNYSKNKYKSEQKVLKILKNKVLILRISNLIGYNNDTSKKKLHKTYIDYFIEFIKKGLIIKNKGIFKDFITINVFIKILRSLIKKNSNGIYNVSFGNKVYIDKINKWLNYYNKENIIYKKIKMKNFQNQDCFYLNNKKLKKEVSFKITLKTLEKECKQISKKIFYEI